MKIYDCFTFFNELDLLEIRIQELYDTVDYFVIAEANMSHSGKSRDYVLSANWDRFAKYQDKIRYLQIDDMPVTNDSWVREKFQRDALARGLYDMQLDDLIVVSDLDEIPRAEILEMIKVDENKYERYVLQVPLFRYKFNFLKWYQPVINNQMIVTRGHVFTNPERERDYTHAWLPPAPDVVYLEHAGWHFSYLGDDKNAIHKLQNFAHVEQNVPEIIDRFSIDHMIKEKCGPNPRDVEKFEYIVFDEYFPKCVVENQEKYKDLIIADATAQITDFWPME
jgi:Glycosyltransferase family 17